MLNVPIFLVISWGCSSLLGHARSITSSCFLSTLLLKSACLSRFLGIIKTLQKTLKLWIKEEATCITEHKILTTYSYNNDLWPPRPSNLRMTRFYTFIRSVVRQVQLPDSLGQHCSYQLVCLLSLHLQLLRPFSDQILQVGWVLLQHAQHRVNDVGLLSLGDALELSHDGIEASLPVYYFNTEHLGRSCLVVLSPVWRSPQRSASSRAPHSKPVSQPVLHPAVTRPLTKQADTVEEALWPCW